MNFKSTLGFLRIAAILEGISYLLFALTMPLKYMYHIDTPNRIVGMFHGLLFIAYVLLVIAVSVDRKWSVKTSLLAGVASLLPFGTFVADAKIFRPEAEARA
jgi:integral membrane protein